MTYAMNHESHTPPNDTPARRSFLSWIAVLSGLFAGVLVAVPGVRFLVGQRRVKVPWVNLGPVADFAIDETRLVTFDNPLRQPWDGITSQTGIYVRRLGVVEEGDPQFLVLSVNCAHLGCPVSWFPQSELFLCPCHGGVYYADGSHASGPPPRGMFHVMWRVRAGELEIQAPHYPTLQDTLRQPT